MTDVVEGYLSEIRNPKLEILDKSEILITKHRKQPKLS